MWFPRCSNNFDTDLFSLEFFASEKDLALRDQCATPPLESKMTHTLFIFFQNSSNISSLQEDLLFAFHISNITNQYPDIHGYDLELECHVSD